MTASAFGSDGMLTGEPGDVTAYRSRRVTPDRRLRGQSMTNYARMYRFGITPWERYRTVAAARISALRDREETERSRPSRPCARPRLRSRSVHPRARAEGVGGRRHRLCAGRVRGGGSKEPERGRAQLRRRRRDAAAVGPAGDVRLLPRHRLLPGFGRRTAPLPGGRCLCAWSRRQAGRRWRSRRVPAENQYRSSG
jgi:hypothetical protein